VKIHSELVRAINHPETRERLLGDGMDVLTGTPGEFGEFLKGELAKWKRVARETKITVD
jgi:hypothetical protein